MFAELLAAFRGKINWNRICKRYNVNSDCVVLVMTENDELWNETFLKYSNAFCSKMNLGRTVILKTASAVLPNKYMSTHNALVITIGDRVYTSLLKYYFLIKYSDSIIFCVKDVPYENLATFVLNKTDLSLDEYVCFGAYRLRGVPNV